MEHWKVKANWPVCVWMNQRAATSKTPIMNAAKAMPITVPESSPSTTTVCPDAGGSSFLILSPTGCCWFTMLTIGSVTIQNMIMHNKTLSDCTVNICPVHPFKLRWITGIYMYIIREICELNTLILNLTYGWITIFYIFLIRIWFWIQGI